MSQPWVDMTWWWTRRWSFDMHFCTTLFFVFTQTFPAREFAHLRTENFSEQKNGSVLFLGQRPITEIIMFVVVFVLVILHLSTHGLTRWDDLGIIRQSWNWVKKHYRKSFHFFISEISRTWRKNNRKTKKRKPPTFRPPPNFPVFFYSLWHSSAVAHAQHGRTKCPSWYGAVRLRRANVKIRSTLYSYIANEWLIYIRCHMVTS